MGAGVTVAGSKAARCHIGIQICCHNMATKIGLIDPIQSGALGWSKDDVAEERIEKDSLIHAEDLQHSDVPRVSQISQNPPSVGAHFVGGSERSECPECALYLFRIESLTLA